MEIELSLIYVLCVPHQPVCGGIHHVEKMQIAFSELKVTLCWTPAAPGTPTQTENTSQLHCRYSNIKPLNQYSRFYWVLFTLLLLLSYAPIEVGWQYWSSGSHWTCKSLHTDGTGVNCWLDFLGRDEMGFVCMTVCAWEDNDPILLMPIPIIFPSK